jgi:RsiW-degrading membrane proteinase PrsW (M82 family)
MTDIVAAAAPFALSFALVSPFYFVLRARLLAFVAGATIVAIGALLFEFLALRAAGDLAGPTLVLLLVAPVVEEVLKFSVSIPTGANYRSAAGAGAGFAGTENGIYFLAAWGEPTATLLVLVAVRALTDPLLHVTTCTLTTSSWRGHPAAFPAGILLHIGWNVLALFVTEVDPVLGVLLLAGASLTLLGIYLLARRSRSIEEAMAGPPRVPWTRAVL